MSEKYRDFRAERQCGEFIYVIPERQIIIVRLGRSRGGVSWKNWKEIFTFFAEEVR